MTRLQFAVFGESLVDITRIDGSVHVRPGGSPLNVAVGLARLGADVEFATSIGRDPSGAAIRAHLAAAGVDLAPGSLEGTSTSVAEASIAADGGADYRFDLAWDPAGVPTGRAAAAHFGSIAAVLDPGAQRVLDWVGAVRDEAIVSFDPNVRPSITGTGPALRDAVNLAAARADIIKASAEDLGFLGDANLPERWLDAGATVVIVTDGGHGARLATHAGSIHVPARVAKLVDTIGAGDSFMAGLLWSLGAGHLLDRGALAAASIDELARHVRFAAGCAAVTVSREGADPPTLHAYAELFENELDSVAEALKAARNE